MHTAVPLSDAGSALEGGHTVCAFTCYIGVPAPQQPPLSLSFLFTTDNYRNSFPTPHILQLQTLLTVNL